MPEGHIVHRLARELTRTLSGSPVRASSPQGRFDAGAVCLDGARLLRAEAWGKYLFCGFRNRRRTRGHDPARALGARRPVPSQVQPPPEPVGATLLDQSVVAGIGIVYAPSCRSSAVSIPCVHPTS
ncbi:MAG: hypothetical protein M5U19_10750 [Microthrixaceae bacterium]|nr:hypothetical protein [Microthrixaceae bacterium]